MSASPAVALRNLSHSYGSNMALSDVSLDIARGEIFALLGPNGGGKSTLFRILSTQIVATGGTAAVCGFPVSEKPGEVRSRIGVVFQSPSLDKKLTAEENLFHQGHLYGLKGKDLQERIDRALAAVTLGSRRRDRVENLSGGMQRRVEIAKALLHDPEVLILDEPSTGLDPSARHDVWQHLQQVRQQKGVTCLITTHLMEEADQADRVGILHQGKLAAAGTPAELKAAVGGEVLELTTLYPQELADIIRVQIGGTPVQTRPDTVRLETSSVEAGVPGARLLVAIVEAAPGLVHQSTVGQPTLNDVFFRYTGRQFAPDLGEVAAA